MLQDLGLQNLSGVPALHQISLGGIKLLKDGLHNGGGLGILLLKPRVGLFQVCITLVHQPAAEEPAIVGGRSCPLLCCLVPHYRELLGERLHLRGEPRNLMLQELVLFQRRLVLSEEPSHGLHVHGLRCQGASGSTVDGLQLCNQSGARACAGGHSSQQGRQEPRPLRPAKVAQQPHAWWRRHLLHWSGRLMRLVLTTRETEGCI
mmetsp:Transcript_124950/g.347892  ORF Transcript_124950/g.347892 Transcript_124950/m.347892 type:complete len:205 (-) Transcript_124950:19-633(-)